MDAERILAALQRNRPSILVVGDVVLDRRWEGSAERLCREGPVPVVDVERVEDAPGGAGNTAVNLAALGARVHLVAVAGDDEPGHALAARLAEAGVDSHGPVRSRGRSTSVKSRMVGQGQLLLRVDACRAADDDEAHAVAAAALELAGRVDAVVLCDYGLGALARIDRGALRTAARALIVDAHTPAAWRDLHADVVTPNAAEAAGIVGGAPPHGDRHSWAVRNADELLNATGAEHTLVTLDRDGTVLLGRAGVLHETHARPAPEQNAVGAGDTFVAGVAFALAAGLPVDDAADVGQAAADVVVQVPGTTTCTADRLHAALRSAQLPPSDGVPGSLPADADRTVHRQRGGVATWEAVRAASEAARSQGRAVVLTNGVFDGLHRGHAAFLEEAAGLGGLLVVGVNSDDSVRQLRGDPPTVGEEDRAAVVAALAAVDHAVVFDSETAVPLIRELRPDVYVKGGDYLPGMLAEAEAVREVGGRLETLGYVERPALRPRVRRAGG
ncbi:PfkB family carbohydrate kinase [Sinomonas sp. R1AF57]|uniref:PfkB family carbohydrate kinase n=1 Tax=Sinomonas sp. R1AF57 TaxID=2020377 RepID=UPI000B5DE7D7|nr:PfkB family carbohydrate kinase [Sinomonas sp. R1AF57]ASN51039.1 bifunctional heptose 7-phosphate kinase/heptose 1-phosphate adenyltransferase [Sinomonas sp. R1AF57]